MLRLLLFTLLAFTQAETTPKTCALELEKYQNCVRSNPTDCYASCADVDMILNPGLLRRTQDPKEVCDAMKLRSCARRNRCCRDRDGVGSVCRDEKRAYWQCIEQEAGCGPMNCNRLHIPRNRGKQTPRNRGKHMPWNRGKYSANSVANSRLRERDGGPGLPRAAEECAEELQLMQECHAAGHCRQQCGDARVEENAPDEVVNFCWMQDCCEECNTEQTNFRQCVEEKTDCSLACNIDENELEEIENYEVVDESDTSYTGSISLAIASLYLVSIFML